MSMILLILAVCSGSGLAPLMQTDELPKQTIMFFVGDSRTQKMLPSTRILLVTDTVTDCATTDEFGRAMISLEKLKNPMTTTVLFCHSGYFCGAIRVQEGDFFEYEEHFIQLAPLAVR